MTAVGKHAVLGLPLLAVDDSLERYRAVSAGDVNEIASDLFSADMTLSIISPYTSEAIEGMLER